MGTNAPHRSFALRSMVDAGDVLTTVWRFGTVGLEDTELRAEIGVR
ncbi:hypothetical protein [Paeniglutamicibacter kerguelensis]|uniref:Uncharacterized protein n=1 Tax=Paeniglutamicibacter kerguelensis TaxID=254788 RepID=A0ABS4XCW5_9MICC|nr:hypothetical protein [Paeniglutamicibacter kerguelensis]MBP2386312.1 hypothetical protein [Paeniglutamicibacter kerguelensis]